MVFVWTSMPAVMKEAIGASFFPGILWPALAGGAYLLLTAAPAETRAKVPPVVLQWLPFAVAFIGIFVSKLGMAQFGFGLFGGSFTIYALGYAVLIFGLLARISKPEDQTARIIIAVGAAMLVPFFFDMLDLVKFSGPVLHIITGLLWMIVTVLGILCALFVVPPAKLPPALQAIDALAPLLAAVLLLWLPTFVVLFGLAALVHDHAGIAAILLTARGLLYLVAYFGVLLMTSPAAYEEAMKMAGKGGGPQPPQGGGYPPPQGGGYPPPQGGGYPPQGGGYPPQGGGWPQQ
jgi:hypothetical protein